MLGKECVLRTQINKNGEDMKGKFGRILGDFVYEESTVATILVEEGHAVEYWGQAKEDVQEQHMRNRQRLISEGKVTL